MDQGQLRCSKVSGRLSGVEEALVVDWIGATFLEALCRSPIRKPCTVLMRAKQQMEMAGGWREQNGPCTKHKNAMMMWILMSMWAVAEMQGDVDDERQGLECIIPGFRLALFNFSCISISLLRAVSSSVDCEERSLFADRATQHLLAFLPSRTSDTRAPGLRCCLRGRESR